MRALHAKNLQEVTNSSDEQELNREAYLRLALTWNRVDFATEIIQQLDSKQHKKVNHETELPSFLAP